MHAQTAALAYDVVSVKPNKTGGGMMMQDLRAERFQLKRTTTPLKNGNSQQA